MQATSPTVIDYLNALVWDGVPRLGRWLVDLAGSEDSVYVRSASRVMLVAAVRRARGSGDTLNQLLILEGPQGCGKSSALRLLAVEDRWFVDLPAADNPRSILEAASGRWIVEATAAARHGGVIKDMFLARSVDEAHPLYRARHACRGRSWSSERRLPCD